MFRKERIYYRGCDEASFQKIEINKRERESRAFFPPLRVFRPSFRPADKIFYLPLAVDPRPFAYQLIQLAKKKKKEEKKGREGHIAGEIYVSSVRR